MIMKMEYSMDDHIAHFNALLPAFRDKRYITVDGKPLFAIYQPKAIPDVEKFIKLWQKWQRKTGCQEYTS